jgi:GntR family transcriptional regulator
MTVDVEPLYATLAGQLRISINNGQIAPGGKLPSESELSEKHRMARITVRRAIDQLVTEGLVISRNGRGHFVRHSTPLVWVASDPERHNSTQSPADAWSRSVRAQGREPSEEIRTETIYADEHVARWLRLPVGEPVSVRRRMRFVDGEPSATADSFYPRSIVSGTEVELPGDVLPGIYSVFERIGRPWVHSTDRLLSRAPTRDESRVLHIPRGVAVTEIIRRSFDANDVPVRLTRIILPGDRHVIEYRQREDLQ